MEFACLGFRIYLMLVICNGIQIPSGIFFQAIGKSIKSAILSLSRQILFLIPAMIILSKMFGIIGALCAGPVADGLAFVIAAILLILEYKNLNKVNVESTKQIDEIINDKAKLQREYYTRNEKLENKDKIFSTKYLVKILEEERTQKLEELKQNNKNTRTKRNS